jgi:putative membrane protein
VKNIVSAICGIALCCVPALAQKKTAGMSMTDQQFMDFAAQTDMMEANLGQAAQSQGAGQEVKNYAQMLVTDHTSDYSQLNDIAGKDSLNVPKGLDSAHRRMLVPFNTLHGAAFDNHYIHEMIAGHTKAIAEFKREAANAQNADLRNYANQALPTLQKHLDGAKDLAKSKGSKATE